MTYDPFGDINGASGDVCDVPPSPEIPDDSLLMRITDIMIGIIIALFLMEIMKQDGNSKF